MTGSVTGSNATAPVRAPATAPGRAPATAPVRAPAIAPVGALAAATADPTPNSATATPGRAPGGWQPSSTQTGLAVGLLAAAASFQKSMMPRGRTDQLIVTALSFGLGFGAGKLAEMGIQKLDEHMPGSRTVARAATLGGGLGLWGAVALASPRTHAGPAVLRTLGAVAAITAGTDIALSVEHDIAEEIGAARGTDDAQLGHLLLLGGAAVVLAGGAIGQRRMASLIPGEAQFTRFATKLDAAQAARLKEISLLPLQPLPELVPIPGRIIDVTTMTKHGARFLQEVTPAARIAEVMRESAVIDPLRFYAPSNFSKDTKVLARAIVDDMISGGAFERSTINVFLTTGTGWANPFAVESAEFMSRGDIATVALQYGTLPSMFSTSKIPKASRLFSEVMTNIREHIATLPADAQPGVVGAGESLGVWAQHSVGKGKPGVGVLDALGENRGFWIGTPYRSKWYKETMVEGSRTDATGRIRELRNIEEFEALTSQEQAATNFFSLRHDNDPVGKLGLEIAWQRPAWLPVAGKRPNGVPPTQQWVPGVSLIHTTLDTKNAMKVVPGVAAASGHDYRGDMAAMVRAAYDHFDPARPNYVNDEQLLRIHERVLLSEVERAARFTQATSAIKMPA